MSICQDFIRDQIKTTKELIVEYQTTIRALVSGQLQAYSLDTGQSKQTVTKANIKVLQDQIPSLFNQLQTLEAQLNGTGSITVIPGF